MKIILFLVLWLVYGQYSMSDELFNEHALIKIGSGKPLVVLHGGPGLDHSYLVDGLYTIANYRQLVFYDQGNFLQRLSDHNNINMSSLVEELQLITENYQGEYGLLAHSAGLILLFEFLQRTPEYLHPNEIIFITPVPLAREVFEADIKYLQSKMSKETLQIISDLRSKPETCLESLNYIFPYYFYKGKIHDIKFHKFDCLLRGKLLAEVANYDYNNLLEYLPKKTIWITGEREVFTKENPIEKWHIIKQAAHFPFVENRLAFDLVITNFLLTP